MLCGVSPRTIDYYTQRGLLEPSHWSRGRQRLYDDRAVQRLHEIKELQAERLTLREITVRLATGTVDAATGETLAARIRSLEEELNRLNRELVELTPQLEHPGDPDERQAVAQVASLALARALTLAQLLATLVREGQGPMV